MNGKKIAAGLLVSIVTVALAIGITVIAASGSSLDLAFSATEVSVSPTEPEVLPVENIVDPNATATPIPNTDCTFPLDSWLLYPETWKIDSYRIGDHLYSKKEMVDTLRSDSSDARGKLLTQIFITVLNQQNGADVTQVRTAFSQAVSWVESFPPGSTPSDGDINRAESFASTLARFNSGDLTVPSCEYSLDSLSPLTPVTGGAKPVLPSKTNTAISPIFTRVPPTPTRPGPEQPRKTSVPALPTLPPPTDIPPTEDLPTAVPTDPPPPPPPDPTEELPTPVPTEGPRPTTGSTEPPLPPPPPVDPSPEPTSAPATLAQPANLLSYLFYW